MASNHTYNIIICCAPGAGRTRGILFGLFGAALVLLATLLLLLLLLMLLQRWRRRLPRLARPDREIFAGQRGMQQGIDS